MAVVRARSSPPYALISTVIVAVAAAALAVLFYLNWNKAVLEAADAQTKLDRIASRQDMANIVPNFAAPASDRSSAIAVAQRQINDLKELIAGDAKMSIDGIKTEVGANKPLLQAYKSIKGTLDQKTAALADLESRVKSLQTEVAAHSKQADDTREADQKTVADLREQLAKANADVAAAVQARDAAIAKAQTDMANIASGNETQIRTYVLENEQTKNELASAQKRIAELLQKISNNVHNADVNVGEPDGQVIRVNAAAGEVYINLTNKDNRVTPGLTFTCFDPRTGVRFGTDEAAQGNGSIEVIQVGATSTLCRITHVTTGHSIQAGDLIANIVYHNDKGRLYRFVVFGDFDLDGDGVATAAERDRLVNMIRSWGGQIDNEITSQTDYLVIGARPSSPTVVADATAPGSVADQRDKQQDKYETLVSDARRMGIPVLNANRFLAMIGYYNTTVVHY